MDQTTPNHVATLKNKADEAAHAGQYEQAREYLKEARKQAPNDPNLESMQYTIDKLETTERRMQEIMGEAVEKFAAGDYRAAGDLYKKAYNLGGQHGVLHHQIELNELALRAHTLAGWQERVASTLKQADHLTKSGRWNEVVKCADALLNELPEDSAFDAVRTQLERPRNEAIQMQSVEDRIANAEVMAQQGDFKSVIRLLQDLPADQTNQVKIRDMLSAANRQVKYINQFHERIDQAISEQRWKDAGAELDRLRTEYPRSPDVWMWSWLRVWMACGQQALAQAQTFFLQQAYSQVKAKLLEAQQAFGRALEQYPSHEQAPRLIEEAKELALIADRQNQAEVEYQAGHREKALQYMRQVMQTVSQARQENRDYGMVGEQAAVFVATLEHEIELIGQQENRLLEGERLESRRLDEARKIYAELQNAVLPEHRRRAKDGLDRVDKAQAEYVRYMEAGSQAADSSMAVAAYEKALAVWPESPQTIKLLLESLVRAAEAKVESQPDQASAYLRRAFELAPNYPPAERIWRKLDLIPQVQGVLLQSAQEMAQLDAKAQPEGREYRAVLAQMKSTLQPHESQLSQYPDLAQQVSGRYEELERRAQQWETYAQTLARAQTASQQGEWQRALAELDKLLAGQPGSGSLKKLQVEWKDALRAIEEARSGVGTALQAAQTAYDSLAQQPVEEWNYEPVRSALERAQIFLGSVEEAVAAAKGPLPEDLEDARDRVEALRVRLDLLRQAQQKERQNTPEDGLAVLKTAIARHPDDEVLPCLAQYLSDKVDQRIPALLKDAEEAVANGLYNNGLDLLRKARLARPEDAQIAARLVQLEKQQVLDEELARLDSEYRSKRNSGSLVDAAEVRSRQIDLLCDPSRVDLDPPVREIIEGLIELSQKESGLAFGKKEHQEQIDGALSSLRQASAGSSGWATRKARVIVESWVEVKRNVATRGVISSSMAFGDLIGAYRGAVLLYNRNSDDEQAYADYERTAKEVVASAKTLADKRLRRAEDLLKQGDYNNALKDLDEIEAKIYGPLDQEFPQLFRRDDEVAAHSLKARQQIERAKRLEKLSDQALPRLEQARKAFTESQWDEMMACLKSLPDLNELPNLQRDMEDLRHKAQVAQVEAAEEKLRQGVLENSANLEQVQTREEVDVVLKAIEQLAKDLKQQWSTLPVESRYPYQELLEAARQKKARYDEAIRWEEQAEAALHPAADCVPDYRQVEQALKRALELAKDTQTRVRILRRLDEIQKDLVRQREREEAEDGGRAALFNDDYLNARRLLRKAHNLGAKVDNLLAMAEAGLLYEGACQVWEQRKDYQSALTELNMAIDYLSQASDDGDSLRNQIQRELNRITAIHDKAKNLETLMSRVSIEVETGDYDTAQKSVDDALALDPSYPKVLEWQKIILARRKAADMVDKARKARDEHRYGEAISQVDMVLEKVWPESPEALILKRELTVYATVDQDLTKALNSARSHDFNDAFAAWKKAAESGALAKEVTSVRTTLDQQEDDWYILISNSIKYHMKDGHFEQAYEELNRNLKLAAAFRQDELLKLQKDLVRQWINKELLQLSSSLDGATPRELDTALITINRFINDIKPEPTTDQKNQLENLKVRLHQRRLAPRFEQSDELIRSGRWNEADVVLQGLRQEVQQHELVFMEIEIDNREWEMHRRQDDAQREQGNKLFQQARQLLDDAKERADIERAIQIIDAAQELPLFATDVRFSAFKAECIQALKLSDATKTNLDNARREIRRGELYNAITYLDNDVSPLLRDRYQDLRTLVQYLREAKEGEKIGHWQDAFDKYTTVVKLDNTLQGTLEAEIEACRKHLSEQYATQIESALRATPPNVESAHTLLEQVKGKAWISRDYVARFEQLGHWLESLSVIPQVQQLLFPNEGDSQPEQAIDLLQNALEKTPTSQGRKELQDWQMLAEAMQSRQTGNLEEALEKFNRISPELKSLARVKNIIDETESRCQRQNLVQQIEKDIQRAIDTSDYDMAVEHMLTATRRITDPETITGLQKRIYQRLMLHLDAARENQHFAAALEVARAIARISPDDPQALTLQSQLQRERAAALNQALDEAQAAVRNTNRSQVDAALARAEIIAAPEGDPHIQSIRKEMESLVSTLSQAEAALKTADLALAESDYPAVMRALDEARRVAPNYPRITEKTLELIAQVEKQSYNLLNTGKYANAYELALSVKRYNTIRGLDGLEKDILDQQRARRDALEQQIESAFKVWDLDAAGKLLVELRSILLPTQDCSSLNTRLSHLQDSSYEILDDMKDGWDALQSHNYETARSAFNSASTRKGNLAEAGLWRDYSENMGKALELSKNFSDLETSSHTFKTAEALMLTQLQELPVFLRTHNLYERRRQAAYDACRLYQFLDVNLIPLLRVFEQRNTTTNLEIRLQALEAGKKMKILLEEFAHRHTGREAPPPGYPTERPKPSTGGYGGASAATGSFAGAQNTPKSAPGEPTVHTGAGSSGGETTPGRSATTPTMDKPTQSSTPAGTSSPQNTGAESWTKPGPASSGGSSAKGEPETEPEYVKSTPGSEEPKTSSWAADAKNDPSSTASSGKTSGWSPASDSNPEPSASAARQPETVTPPENISKDIDTNFDFTSSDWFSSGPSITLPKGDDNDAE